MQANSNRDAQLFSSLSFALSSYSAQVVRMHQEDLVAKQNAEGGTKAERSFTDFTINNSPLPPPSQEALQFLMNCVIRISKDTAIIIPVSLPPLAWTVLYIIDLTFRRFSIRSYSKALSSKESQAQLENFLN